MLREFAIRLDRRAAHLGLSQADIANRLGAKAPRVSNWFQGRNFPRARERVSLANILGVNLDWLIKGEGEPERFPENEVHDAAGEYLGPPVREVPVISWTHAGEAANFEAMPKHWQGRVATTSRDPRAFALTIEGDSMEPRFFAGDRVICEPSLEPINGKPVVAKYVNDAVQLRIYHKLANGRIRLASLRPEIYPAEECARDGFHWIFPVRELIRSV